jgi:hypothetical protein
MSVTPHACATARAAAADAPETIDYPPANDGMISKNMRNIMIFVCLRTNSNMRELSMKKKKANNTVRLCWNGGG